MGNKLKLGTKLNCDTVIIWEYIPRRSSFKTLY